MKIYAQVNGQQFEFERSERNGDQQELKQDGRPVAYDLVALGAGRYSLIKNGRSYLVHLMRNGQEYHVHVAGDYFQVAVEDERQKRLKELVKKSHHALGEQEIKAPIPGLVIKVHAREGQAVAKNEPLLVLEAMKMENIIKAPCDCKVAKVFVAEQQAVQQNQSLLKLITEE